MFRHRLQVAGLSDDREIFNGAALRQIFRLSGGVPRVINLLCDRAMMGAYGRDQATVSPNLVAEAAKETFGAQGAHGRGECSAMGEPGDSSGRSVWAAGRCCGGGIFLVGGADRAPGGR